MWLKQKTPRSEEYKSWIAWQPCCACHPQAHRLKGAARIQGGGIAHHYGRTGKGMGQKCSDFETVPICLEHHNEIHFGGRKRFEKKYRIDIEQIGATYREVFSAI